MSSKRETHRAELRPLLLAALESSSLMSPDQFKLARFSLDPVQRANLLDPTIAALEDYLIDHSALPGRRANLELVAALADEVAALCADPEVSLARSYVALDWLLWQLMNRHPPAIFGEDPDSPLQMPELCGIVARGEWAAAFQQIEGGVADLLRHGCSPLWRIREGAAMGLQRMLARRWASTFRRLRRCALDATPLQWRAMIAGVAEPDLLRDPAQAADALDLHYSALVFLRRLPPDVRRNDDVRTLRKALGYSVSVVAAALPELGLAQMHAWALWRDPDVDWLLRENLKKKRLAAWPDALDTIRAALDQG